MTHLFLKTNFLKGQLNPFSQKIVLCFILFFMNNIFADQFHYKNLLVGERPSSMGGAYTALSNDLYGLAYNPAGVLDSNQKIALTFNTLSFSSVVLEDFVLDENKELHDFSRNSIGIIPGYLGTLFPTSFGNFGFYLAVRDQSAEEISEQWRATGHFDEDDTLDTLNFHLSIDLNSIQYDASLTFSKAFSDHLSFGISTSGLYYSHKEILFMSYDRDEFLPDLESMTHVRTTSTLVKIMPKIGLLYQTPSFRVGMTYSHPFSIYRDYIDDFSEYYFYNSYDEEDPNNGINTFSNIHNKQAELPQDPHSLSLGLALINGDFTISADIDYHSSTNGTLNNLQDPTSYQTLYPNKEVINTAIGIEHIISQYFAWRLGAFTDFSNKDIPTQSTDYIPYHEDSDIFGMTAAIKTKIDSKEYTLGVVTSYGMGKATMGDLNNISANIEDHSKITRKSITVFVGFGI